MDAAKRRRTNDTGYVNVNQGIQGDSNELTIRCGERGGLHLTRDGTFLVSQQLLSEMTDIQTLQLGDTATETLLDTVSANLNVIQYRGSDTDPHPRYAVSVDDLRTNVPSLVDGDGVVYGGFVPLLTLLAKRQRVINQTVPKTAVGEIALIDGYAFVDIYQTHGSDLVQTLTGEAFGVAVRHIPPTPTTGLQLAITTDVCQAYDGRVFLILDTGSNETQGSIHYSIAVGAGGSAPRATLYSGVGFTGTAIDLDSPGWYRDLGPLTVGSVYVPFGRSVSLYATGDSGPLDPSGVVLPPLHLHSSVSDLGALPVDTYWLTWGAVRSAVVGAGGTGAVPIPGAASVAPLSLRPFPVDVDPRVPIHWLDAWASGTLLSNRASRAVVARDGDPVDLWEYAGGPSSTWPAVATGATKPVYHISKLDRLPAVSFPDDTTRLLLDLRGNNTPRMVNTTVFLVVDASGMVNDGVLLGSVGTGEVVVPGSLRLEARLHQTLHLYQSSDSNQLPDNAITTNRTTSTPDTRMVIAFRVTEQAGDLTLTLYDYDTSNPQTLLYQGVTPREFARAAHANVTHLQIGAAGVHIHELRVYPASLETNDVAAVMTQLQSKWPVSIPKRDLTWAWYDFADPMRMSSDETGASLGVNHNDNVRFVKDKSGNGRNMSNTINHAYYVDGSHPLAINSTGVLRLEVGPAISDLLRYALATNAPTQMSRLLVFRTQSFGSSYSIHPSTTDSRSHLLDSQRRTRDVFASDLPSPDPNQGPQFYDEPLNNKLVVSYASYYEDAQGNTIVTTHRFNTLETAGAVQRTGNNAWFSSGNYMRCGIQGIQTETTDWCLAEVIYWSTALDQGSLQQLRLYLAQKWGWVDLASAVRQPVATPLLLHLDASDTNTLYTDEAGTQAVTVAGDPIRFIADKSGNGNHAIRWVYMSADDGAITWSDAAAATGSATGAIRGNSVATGAFEYTVPRLLRSINTKMQQSGATLVLTMKFPPFADFTGDNYKYIKHPFSPVDGGLNIMDGNARVVERFGYGFRFQTGAVWDPITTFTDAPILYVVVAGDSSQQTSMWVNGKQKSLMSYDPSFLDYYYSLGDLPTSAGWYGDLLELRVYDRPFEGTELTSLNNELMTKWGVTPDA